MKKFLLFLLVVAVLAACKKNTSSPKLILLSAVLVNGHTETEFTYNALGQLTEERYYNEHSPYELVGRYEYIYDKSGNLKESKGYDAASNKVKSHLVYQLDGQERIARTTYYEVNGLLAETFSTHIDNEYQSNGRVSKQTWKDEDEKLQSYRLLQYYPNGNLRTSESWHQWGGPTPEKSWGSSYGPSDTTLPASFYSIKAYPINFYYPYLVSSYTRHFVYEDGQVDSEWRDDMSGRKYNARGLVTQVTVTTKTVIPAGPKSEKIMEFEYVEK